MIEYINKFTYRRNRPHLTFIHPTQYDVSKSDSIFESRRVGGLEQKTHITRSFFLVHEKDIPASANVVRLKRCCETLLLNWEGDGWVASSALLCYQKTRPPRSLGSLFNVIGMVWFEMAVDQVSWYIYKRVSDDLWWWWWWVMRTDDMSDKWWDELWWVVMRSVEWWGMRCVMWEQVLQPGIEQRF